MNIQMETVSPDTALAVLDGRLDLLTSLDVRKTLQEAVAKGQNRIVIDLHKVPFMDSSGLGALIGALKAARLAGGDLRLARAGEQVRYVLEVTLLDRVLKCHASVEDALARYA